MKFISTFAYTADVVPKGSRKQRREVLFAQTELEIPDLAPEVLVPDAVAGTVRPERGEGRRFSFAGHDGALWSPLQVNPTYAGQRKSTVPYFLETCRTPWPAGHRTDNPLSSVYDGVWGPRDVNGLDRGSVERNTEDNYAGKVIDVSRRAEAIERCRAAARDLINVDGTIYVRRPDPVWEVPATTAPEALLGEAPSRLPGRHRFRIDRLDAALAWARHGYRGEVPARGEIERCDPAYLTRDDLSHFLTNHLWTILDGAQKYLTYLSPTQVMAWHRLSQAKDRIGIYQDAPFPLPLEDALNDVRWLCGPLTDVALPASYLGVHEVFVRDHLAPFMARFDFETSRRPRVAATADEEAIARLGSP